MPEPVDLAYAFGLEPRAAVEYFRSKGYAITFSWDAMAAEAHARAFTVAKVTQMDALISIREEVDRALATGITLEQFKKNLEPRLRALGWWGKRVTEAPDGTAQLVSVSTPHRLETIYRTNLQSAYMAGRFRSFIENAGARPYWQYVAVMDERTRPAHAAMNGRVFRFDDPIWKSCWPPNGYNCRCRVRALTKRDLEARGLAESESGDNLDEFQDADPKTGEVFERVSYKGPGMDRPFAPDRGFVGNQAMSASSSEIAAGSKARALYTEGDRALRDMTLEGWGAWTQWIDGVFESGVSRGQSRVLGYAQNIETQFMKAKNMNFATGSLEIEDRIIVGRKAERHAKNERALSIDEWKVLPIALLDRQAVLYDVRNETLLYVTRVGVGNDVRVVVTPALEGRRKFPHDSVRSVQFVNLEDLVGGLEGDLYELVDGQL
jgi:SPP1 gp7 family putative phage head morphogenesis protein